MVSVNINSLQSQNVTSALLHFDCLYKTLTCFYFIQGSCFFLHLHHVQFLSLCIIVLYSILQLLFYYYSLLLQDSVSL